MNGITFYLKHCLRSIVKVLMFLALSVVAGIAGIAVYLYFDNPGPTVTYLESKFHDSRRTFVERAFEKIPEASPGALGLAVAAEITEYDTIFPLLKGYRLIAFDSGMIRYEYVIPDYQYVTYKDRVDVRTKWDFESIPEVDFVTASFILPFYDPEDFSSVWKKISEKLKEGGFFIGNFFDPAWNILSESDKKRMTFHSEEGVRSLFEGFEIILLEKVNHTTESGACECYYEVFAKKRSSNPERFPSVFVSL